MTKPNEKCRSPHYKRVLSVLETHVGWLDSNEISNLAKVAPRTARQHLQNLVKQGAVEVQPDWPAFKYKIKQHEDK